MTFSTTFIPKSIEEAVTSAAWKCSVDEEMIALKQIKKKLVDLPYGK